MIEQTQAELPNSKGIAEAPASDAGEQLSSPASSEVSNSSLDRSLARAVAWSAGARWASQILSWASTIVVARLLSPSDYGLVGMAGLYLNFTMLISRAGITDMILALRELTERTIAELNTLSVILGLALVGVSLVVAAPIAHFFSTPPLAGVVAVSGLMYLFSGFQIVPRTLLQRELRFKLLASIDMVSAFCQIFITVVLAWLKFGYWSLVVGYLTSFAVTSILAFAFRPYEFALPRIALMRSELRFARQALLSQVATYVYGNADFLVAGRMLGGQALGNYTVGWTIASAPVDKIASLFTGVAPAYFSTVQADRLQLRRYLLGLTEALSLVTVPASIGIALVPDYIVLALLGPKWSGVVGPLRLLGIFIAGRSIATILPNILTATREARFVMWATIASAIIMPIAFLIGSRWGTSGIAAAWVIAYPPVMVPMYYKVFQKTGTRLKEYISVLIPAISASAVMAAAVLFSRFMLPLGTRPLLSLLLTAAVGALSYCSSLAIFHRSRMSQTITMLRSIGAS